MYYNMRVNESNYYSINKKLCIKLEIGNVGKIFVKRRIYTYTWNETQMRENTDGYVIRRRHGRDFARDGRERPTEKCETIDTRENECSTMRNECNERRRVVERETPSLHRFSRADAAYAREYRHPSTQAHTLPRNNSIS